MQCTRVMNRIRLSLISFVGLCLCVLMFLDIHDPTCENTSTRMEPMLVKSTSTSSVMNETTTSDNHLPITYSIPSNESYTAIILTYKRASQLNRTVEHMLTIPHVAAIIVVWNEPSKEDRATIRTDAGIPIRVVPMDANSINNRFKVYELVETEGVFQMDDDIILTPAQLTFAFRAWQENRDRIVGFVGRMHSYNQKKSRYEYLYKPECRASMALTGAAFLHNHYQYLYYNSMPEEVRKRVDKLTNCEDIAMNFLIAHTVKRPPVVLSITLTPKETTCFNCGGGNLSLKKDHLSERHQCLNYFTKVYGYMPLEVTKLRVAPPSAIPSAKLGSSSCKYG